MVEKSVGVPDKVPVSDAVQGSDGGDLGNGAVMSGGGEIVRERFRTLFWKKFFLIFSAMISFTNTSASKYVTN